jgi:hypothetical protein
VDSDGWTTVMGKVRRSAADRSAASERKSDDPLGGRPDLASRVEDRKTRALKIFTGLQSLETHDRLIAATAIAGLFEGGTPQEHAETVREIQCAPRP